MKLTGAQRNTIFGTIHYNSWYLANDLWQPIIIIITKLLHDIALLIWGIDLYLLLLRLFQRGINFSNITWWNLSSNGSGFDLVLLYSTLTLSSMDCWWFYWQCICIFILTVCITVMNLSVLKLYLFDHNTVVENINNSSSTNRCNGSNYDPSQGMMLHYCRSLIMCLRSSGNSGKADAYIITLKVMSALIVTICLMRITVELFQLFIYSGEYLTSWVNLIEGFLYFGTIVFVLSDYEFCELINWRWQLGALCIFLSWINFVLFLSKEPTFGIYWSCLKLWSRRFWRQFPWRFYWFLRSVNLFICYWVQQ